MEKLKLALILLLVACTVKLRASDRPNIVWISAEDHGPHLGCYGDNYANTPHLDAFAEQSLRYTKASSNAPVCAPARTTTISGMYPPSLGAHNMRSRVPSPSYLKFFPVYLREAGYYTTNQSKEDYNLETDDKGWDESSKTAHWKNRTSTEQPFFAVFNYTGTHESQIRNENETPRHDPQLAPLPPYHPDIPEIRKDWAQYYDRLTELDSYFQSKLDELEAAGLSDDTIVIFWSDHGSGMPRGKRYPGWSGLHVAMIAHIPEKFQHLAPEDYLPGGTSDRLVSFVDLAPTTLALAGIEAPDYYHGQAFLGERATATPSYSYGFKGRMDERIDECRTVTDGRYVYIRNYYPHLPHGQYLWYQQQTQTTSKWYQLFNDGKLNDVQSAFWEPHPAEELFDLAHDPHETENLANSPALKDTLATLRAALADHQNETRDLSFIPEPIIRKAVLAGESPAEAFASYFEPNSDRTNLPQYPIPQYWKFANLLSASEEEIQTALPSAIAAIDHEEPSVAVVASELVALKSTDIGVREQALETLVAYARYPENELILSLQAGLALDHAHAAGVELPDSVNQLIADHESIPGWAKSYRPRLLERFQN
ncbi:sulfatase [Pelagicoccus sp. SDUM812002]|uniref:sulfatase family protein n=1 Tax=Pelagicoccus sp. SDUM812002 TaxID=3041266 RepID=UPI00280F4E64|nr:sulfatase [Pelagicoccus sp. SDUM812002]MDQ8187302.1 sulfatase [Pelagicoccus sp. SDUM812002]